VQLSNLLSGRTTLVLHFSNNEPPSLVYVLHIEYISYDAIPTPCLVSSRSCLHVLKVTRHKMTGWICVSTSRSLVCMLVISSACAQEAEKSSHGSEQMSRSGGCHSWLCRARIPAYDRL
jgi:hypothetical protein